MTWVAAILFWHALAGLIPAQPRSIPARLLGIWWVASWIGQSFALPLALAAAAVTAFAADHGEGAGVALGALATLGFALAHWRNRRAGAAMLRAMGLAPRIPWIAGLWPIVGKDRSVRRIRGIPYGPEGVRHTLDLVMPVAPPAGPMPVLIHVHGGAWITGRKDQQAKPLIHHLAANGWLVVDLNYRLGPTHRLPVQVSDVLRAVAWVKANAAQHHGDPARIAVTGGSAGGHLTAMAALAHDDAALKPGFEAADCAVAAAVPAYGRFDMLDRARRSGRNHAALTRFAADKFMPGPPDERWNAVSPIDRVRDDAPPMLVIHGTGDVLLPHQEAAAFVAALSTPVTYVPLRGIEHAYDIAESALTWAHVRAVRAWLERTI